MCDCKKEDSLKKDIKTLKQKLKQLELALKKTLAPSQDKDVDLTFKD